MENEEIDKKIEKVEKEKRHMHFKQVMVYVIGGFLYDDVGNIDDIVRLLREVADDYEKEMASIRERADKRNQEKIKT